MAHDFRHHLVDESGNLIGFRGGRRSLVEAWRFCELLPGGMLPISRPDRLFRVNLLAYLVCWPIKVLAPLILLVWAASVFGDGPQRVVFYVSAFVAVFAFMIGTLGVGDIYQLRPHRIAEMGLFPGEAPGLQELSDARRDRGNFQLPDDVKAPPLFFAYFQSHADNRTWMFREPATGKTISFASFREFEFSYIRWVRGRRLCLALVEPHHRLWKMASPAHRSIRRRYRWRRRRGKKRRALVARVDVDFGAPGEPRVRVRPMRDRRLQLGEEAPAPGTGPLYLTPR